MSPTKLFKGLTQVLLFCSIFDGRENVRMHEVGDHLCATSATLTMGVRGVLKGMEDVVGAFVASCHTFQWRLNAVVVGLHLDYL
jgi:hypothetical protein